MSPKASSANPLNHITETRNALHRMRLSSLMSHTSAQPAKDTEAIESTPKKKRRTNQKMIRLNSCSSSRKITMARKQTRLAPSAAFRLGRTTQAQHLAFGALHFTATWTSQV